MAAPLPRLAASRDPGARPLRRALKTTLLDQMPEPEREWSDRIEAKRVELVADGASTGPPFEPGTDGARGRFSMGREETTIGVAASFMNLSPIWCLLMMRLVRELAPQSCLELGTGFGISTAYQAAALELNGSGRLTTLEGSPAWAERAERTLSELGLARVETRVGPIAETLAEEVDRRGPFDFVFIDAEHQAEATLDHFRMILPGLGGGALVVFDDVDWAEMKSAHAQIGRNERVTTSLTIARLGFSVVAPPPSASP